MGRALVLALLPLVVLAGCSAPLPSLEGEGRAGTERHPGTPVATQQGTETPVPTARDRPNPWNETQLTVAIDATATGDREVAYLVRHAAAYWSKHSEAFAGYFVTFAVAADAEAPDVLVRFTDDIEECGHVEHAAGCASFVDSPADIDRPEVVAVKTGLSDASTEHVVRHELGHLLGIEHGEPPKAVMRPNATLETLPRPNATQRVFPWPDTTFGVYLDLDDAPDEAAAREQVRHALAYYERGPEGMPGNLSFTLVDDPAAAEIAIRYREDGACELRTESCVQSRGPDPDGDGAIEEYHHATITLHGVDTEAIGWHVGNWLAYVFGAEARAQRPPPFRDASPAERRNDWWKDD